MSARVGQCPKSVIFNYNTITGSTHNGGIWCRSVRRLPAKRQPHAREARESVDLVAVCSAVEHTHARSHRPVGREGSRETQPRIDGVTRTTAESVESSAAKAACAVMEDSSG